MKFPRLSASVWLAIGGIAIGGYLTVRYIFDPSRLPWWHHIWDRWRGTFAGSTRADAEAKLKSLGLASEVSETEYGLARCIASEVGGGTPEEKVCQAEVIVNRASKRKSTIIAVLDAGFASTKQSPSIDDVLIAKFVLSGQSKNYARGANNTMGYDQSDFGTSRTVVNQAVIDDVNASAANNRQWWVGPIPGVDPWHLFLYCDRQDYTVADTLAALRRGRASWSTKIEFGVPAKALAVSGLALAAGITTSAVLREDKGT